ncbi:beta-galactosidase [Microbacterium hominis]|uniref:beta-galactosidase n=1 Tax=Microbacterium hominis TaxID=162426 RepID=A0A7D4QE05_9MICO|nr:beta-galactosidase [Microbacterium hominis]QKJ20637.1 beta-galactosidase [Microbacterium hominis]
MTTTAPRRRIDRLAHWRRGPRLGSAYYNEYLPDPSRLAIDLQLMREAGLSVIRVGESVWSTWEPREGVFDLEWLTPVLDGAADHGIDVILGTPTYAIPPWLQVKHPELAVVRRDGSPVPWGGRQEVDYTSELFRGYARRVIETVVGRHGRHSALVAVQLDNEAGLHLIHNEQLVARFRGWVADRFETPDELNRAWGLAYWSHRISSFDELWAPAGNTTPAYDLAWRRFQAEQTTAYLAWQAEVVRPLVAETTALTTCIAYGRPAMDDVAVGATLDIAGGNAYAIAQDALQLEREGAGDQWFADDVPQLVLLADRMRGSRQEPFLVTETGAASIGAAHQTRPPYAGQLGQTAWLLASRGARLVSYWHWHTLHSGWESHWGGILGHDLRPGRIHGEIADIAAQFAAAEDWLADAVPDAQVAILSSRDAEWMMDFEPPLARADGSADPRSFARIQRSFARAVLDAGLQAGVVDERQLPDATAMLARFPIVVAAGLFCLADRTMDVLVEYVRRGGVLILGPRTGVADGLGRVRSVTAPGVLRAAAGVRHDEFAALSGEIALRGSGPLEGVEGVASGWIDGLVPEGGEVVAGYRHPHYGRFAAAVAHSFGEGRVLTVGTIADRAMLARLLAAVAPAPDPAPPVAGLAGSMTAHSLIGPRGRVWVLHNWSPHPSSVTTARAAQDLLHGGRAYPSGETVTLGPWAVAVWADSALA